MRNKFSRPLTFVAVVLILLIGGWLRFFNLNWDRGTHLHPDERYLTMVVSAVRFPGEGGEASACQGLPACLRLYWDTNASPLNPANYAQYANYVYGTLPLFTTRAAARWVDRTCAPEAAPLAAWTARILFNTPQTCLPGHYTGYGGIHLVGRGLSALADLVTLVGLMLIAYVLYGRRVSILSGILYAAAALPIQHAHFFVVDSFATVFVVWTLLFCVLSQRKRKPWLLLPAGLLTGLAVASKASVWPLALMVALAGLVQLIAAQTVPRISTTDTPSIEASPSPVAHYASGNRDWIVMLGVLALSGLLAAVAFRTGQPYAFAGPRFLDVGLNPGWMATMREIQELMRGLRDVPFGHQWTARTPMVFPWRNMVFWGLGLPLGLAAWGGWLWMGWRIVIRRWQWQHIVPWAWGTLFFLYQSTQWVKSMRYLLPVYPVFTMFAAWALIRFMDMTDAQPSTKPWRHRLAVARRVVSKVAAAVVLVGTLLWAFAFLSIYRQPVTRIEASRWLYAHAPTTVQLQTTTGERLNVAVAPDVVLTRDNGSLSTSWFSAENVVIEAVVLPKVSDANTSGARSFTVEFGPSTVHATVSLPAPDLEGASVGTAELVFMLDAPVTAKAGDTYSLVIALSGGESVELQTSVIANEHWDDGLPLRLEGRDPFWDWYRGLPSSPTGQMNNYDNDTLEKRAALLGWLDDADYIVFSSNRLYGSIPRLPSRYPLTTEYYRLLFNGALGFELAAEFVSYAALGPCQFPDQEIPFESLDPIHTTARPCSILFPPAEEAFSVYDHPTVLIFQKTLAYSRSRAEVLLPASLVDNVVWMTPREATLGPNRAATEDAGASLLMSPRMRLEQEEGGTWSVLFNRQVVQNALPFVGALLWAFVLSVLGWAAFPIVYRILPNLRYHGYGLSRLLGLLIWAYVAWLLASLRLLPHTRAGLGLVLLALVGVSTAIAYRHRTNLRAFIIGNWRRLLAMDLIFLGLYLFWVAFRAMNPDLWHPGMGGEKPMDFAYLNAVIKSTWFPPYDPWFTGGQLNYYYFGFVMVGSLVKLLGIVPSIAYNLAIPSLFALTGLGAYTLADTLAGGSPRRGMRAGLWAIFLVVIIGNLGEVQMLYKGLAQVGGVSFESLIPGYPNLVSAVVGLWKVVVEGVRLPFRPEWWYWNPTRIIPVWEGEVGPINEFPVFTFLYADLHAHAMALPLTQAALAFAVQWGIAASMQTLEDESQGSLWRTIRRWGSVALPQPVPSLLVAGLVGGALRATNTWDYPTYLVLMSVGFFTGVAVREFAGREGRQGSPFGRVLAGALTPVLLFAIAEWLFRPYVQAYVGAYTTVEAWNGSRTPLPVYLIMYGMFMFPIGIAGLAFLRASGTCRWHIRRTNQDAVLWPVAIVMTVLVFLLLLIGYYRVSIAWLAVPLGGLALLLLTDGKTPLMHRFLWFWTGSALALSLFVEVAVLKGDIGRMNTVFKFHLQVWMLLAMTAAIFIERLMHGSGTLLARLGVTRDLEIQTVEPCVPLSALDSDTGDLVQVQEPVTAAPEEDDLVGDTSIVSGANVFEDERTHYALAEGLTVVVVTIAGALIFLAALYPVFAIPARIRDRWVPSAPRTLNGMAYMPHAIHHERGAEIPLAADYDVIRWLQDNVEGSPTIMEGQAEREYLWGSRISVYTGLPSVVGWRWHQVQQRMRMPSGTVEARQQDVRTFYNVPDIHRAWEILKRYDVAYIILTPYERAYMTSDGLPKFDEMVELGWLEPVYLTDVSAVYRVIQ